MKRILIIAVLLATRLLGVNADVDPNFYIYICFGQSNMEGNASPESVDKSNVDKRFRLLATCNFSSPKRTLGEWYDATPPLVSPNGGLGPTDYFGRTMVAALPSNVRIGVIPVAMGGSPIEMFDKDLYQQKMKDNPNEWWVTLAKNHYGGNPYGRIIDMAKKAQEVGVIKGILLHQGCSNNGDSRWPGMVKKIYNDMLTDLGLQAEDVPLFVGETLRQENGGSCYAHNTQVARMPSVVPTSYVISSEGCPGNGKDPWHFNAAGYRILGKRYALKALEVMGRAQQVDDFYEMDATLRKFYAAKSLTIDKEIQVVPGQQMVIPVKATFEDGHTETVSNEMVYQSDDITFENGVLAPKAGEEGTVTAIYTDFVRHSITTTFNVKSSLFPLKKDKITTLAGSFSFDESTGGFKLGAGGQAGWVYDTPVDMSAYKYMVVKLKEQQDIGGEVRLYPAKSVNAVGYRDTINARTTVCIDLHNLHYSTDKIMNPEKIYMVVLRAAKAGTLYVDDIFLTNDEQYSPTGIETVAGCTSPVNGPVFTLDGRRLSNGQLRPGIYIQNGRKKIIK